MKEFKGTKGKWESYKNTVRIYKQPICDAWYFGSISLSQAEANAKLIAKAPEMLELLQNLENDDNSIPKIFWDKRNELLNEIL